MPSTNGSLVSAAVAVTLDGRELLLRYSALAFIRYAEVLDRDLLADIRDVGRQAQEQGGLAHSGQLFMRVRDILWAGLLDRQPETERDAVARMFGLDDLARIMPAIVKALNGTMPSGTTEPPRPTRARKPPRLAGPSTDGSDSGPTSAPDAESAPVNSAP
jgi:hypothetical protein